MQPVRHRALSDLVRLSSLSLVLTTAGLVGGAAAAPDDLDLAQREPQANQDLVLRTGLHEASRAENWRGVRDAFRALEARSAVDDPRLVYLHAQACYQLGDLDAATGSLSRLSALRSDDLEGLYLGALVAGRQTDRATARDRLLDCARAGRNVLADLQRAPDREVLGWALQDPAFVLALMQAGREVGLTSLGAEPPRSPFAAPLVREQIGEPPPVVPPPVPAPISEQLEREIDALFAQLERQAALGDYEGLVALIRTLGTKLDSYAALRLAESKLEEYIGQLEEADEVVLAIRLQLLVAEGNQHLRAMAAALEEGSYDVVLTRNEELLTLAENMSRVDRPVFDRNARALAARGEALASRARLLQQVEAFALDVTGIVLPEPGEAPVRAIVDDRIYGVGDTVRDPRTDDPIDELRIVEIHRSTVTFSYQGEEFVRLLRQRTP
jgi:tetratricopeptide (TPR) repeat protein